MNTAGSTLFFFLGTLFTAGDPPAPPTSLNEIKSQCTQLCARQTSLSATMRMLTESLSGEVKILTDAKGTYEHLWHKGLLLFRVDLKNTVTQVAGAQTATDEHSVTTIGDGRFAYTLSTQPGKPPTAMRTLPKPAQTFLADAPFFTALDRDFQIRVLPDETLDKKAVWVLETTPKAPSRARVVKSIYYILKDSGIRVRNTGHDATGRRVQMMELADIKFDAPLKPERFVFTVPKGVRVVDLTQQ